MSRPVEAALAVKHLFLVDLLKRKILSFTR